MTEHRDVLIVGAGPAGVSTALHLVALDPNWADRIVILEKHPSPRHKVCGGGVTAHGLATLRELSIPMAIPGCTVGSVRFIHRHRQLSAPDSTGARVFSRRLFDAALLDEARRRGVEIREGEAYLDSQMFDGLRLVRSSTQEYTCRALVGADGSAGRVAALFPAAKMMAGLRAEIRVDATEAARSREFQLGELVFDFAPIDAGWYGYFWRFPSQDERGPFLNCGFFHNRRRNSTAARSPRGLLQAWLAGAGLGGAATLEAFPVRRFGSGSAFSARGVLLVGDAVGVDPLLGEGISEALIGGKLAAAEIHEGLARGDNAFGGYRKRVMRSRLGSMLRTTSVLGALFYSWQNPFWLGMILESRSVRRYVEERFPGYPHFYRDKRILLGALLRWAFLRG